MEPILLIAIPLVLAFLSILSKSMAKYILAGAALLNIIIAVTLRTGTYVIGGFKPPFGISLVVDDYSLYSVIFLNVLFTLTLLLAFSYAQKISSILLVGLAALNGMLLTGDLFNLFVFLEIASIAAYLIVASTKRYVAVFNYLVIATVGSSLYLLGVVLLYAQYGTLNMAAMSKAMQSGGVVSSIPIIFIFIGLAVETKLVPMNGWVRAVLKDANPLTGPMIASVYAGVMLMVFGRIMSDVLVLNDSLKLVFSIVALVTIIAGEAAAFSGKKLREILLYSSVAQSGLAALLFINGIVAGAMLVVFGNVIVKFILFMIAGHMAASGTDDVEELRGIFKENPLNGLAFTISGLSLIGLPMFFGFAAKMNVLVNLFKAGLWWMPIVILLASLVEGAYVVRMLVVLWNPGDEGQLAANAESSRLVYPIKRIVCITTVLVSLCLLVLGFAPSQVVDKANKAAAGIEGNIGVTTITEEGGNH